MLGLNNLFRSKECPKFCKNIFYNKAFTLSELLITLAVVGILAAIVLPIIHAIVPDQNSLMAKRVIAVTQTAMAEVMNNNDCYPERNDRLGIDDGYKYSRCSLWSGSSATEGDAAAKFVTLFQSNLDVKTGASISNGMSSATITTKDGLVWNFRHLDRLRDHKRAKNSYVTLTVDTNGDKRPNCGQSDVLNRCPNTVTKGFDTFTMRIYEHGKIIVEDCWAVDSIKVDKKLTGSIDTLGTCVSLPLESSFEPETPEGPESPSCPESYTPTGPDDACCGTANFPAGTGYCDACFPVASGKVSAECCQKWFEDPDTYGYVEEDSIANSCCAAGEGGFCDPCYSVSVSGATLGCCEEWYRSESSSPDYDKYSFAGVDIDELDTVCCAKGYSWVCPPDPEDPTPENPCPYVGLIVNSNATYYKDCTQSSFDHLSKTQVCGDHPSNSTTDYWAEAKYMCAQANNGGHLASLTELNNVKSKIIAELNRHSDSDDDFKNGFLSAGAYGTSGFGQKNDTYYYITSSEDNATKVTALELKITIDSNGHPVYSFGSQASVSKTSIGSEKAYLYTCVDSSGDVYSFNSTQACTTPVVNTEPIESCEVNINGTYHYFPSLSCCQRWYNGTSMMNERYMNSRTDVDSLDRQCCSLGYEATCANFRCDDLFRDMTTAVVPTPMTKAECEANKSKYGIQGCPADTDYLAGAKKMCGDLGMRLPTFSELDTDFRYCLYKAPEGENGFQIYPQNVPSALSGIGSGWQKLWSSEEWTINGHEYSGYTVNFYNSYLSNGGESRGNSSGRAVCIK